ncbi:MAG: hypothetical protein JRG73_16200 [Deltaproteobacteria bacterium]|nr:hypothetical protein [Deltaproteobacteria bacterium]
MKRVASLFLYVVLSAAILAVPMQAWGELFSTDEGDLMAWVTGRHLTLTWDPVQYATGETVQFASSYSIQAGFPPCEPFISVMSLDVGTSTAFSVSNAGEGTYCLQVSAFVPTIEESIWDSNVLELVVRGDASNAGEGGEYTGVWNITMSIQPTDDDSCGGYQLLSETFPIMVDQRGQSLLVVLGDFNFRGALRQDNTFLLAGAQTWRYENCHHTFRFYMDGAFSSEDNTISGGGEFHDTWHCRERGRENADDQDTSASVERIRPDNPGGGRPDNPGGGQPDNPGGGRPDNPGGGRPDNPGGGNGGSRVSRCTLIFTLSGEKVSSDDQ